MIGKNDDVTNRVVAFLDVLGFKQIVEHVPHDDLLPLYRGLQIEACTNTTHTVFPDDHRKFDSDPVYSDEELKQRRVVNVLMASDSVILFSESDGWRDALSVIASVTRLLVAGFRRGVPMRGAITVGPLDVVDEARDIAEPGDWTTSTRALVGLGLVRAYELEGGFEWSGAVIHPDLVAHLEQIGLGETGTGTFSAWDATRASQAVVQADLPRKRKLEQGNTVVPELGWAVNWPFAVRYENPPLEAEQVRSSFASYSRDGSVPGVVEKAEHTLAFLAAVDSRHI